MTIRSLGIYLFFLTFYTSCVDRFYPEVEKYDGLLVVDGGITNEPGPYTLRLNRSIGVYDLQKEYIGVTNAEVMILEEGGTTVLLTEVAVGVYKTDSLAITGTPGHSYKLSIRLPEGVIYETPYEKMVAPTPIASVESKLEYKYFLEEEEIPGYQFYVTGGTPPEDKNYYLWRGVATYEYHADFTVDYIFEGSIAEFPNPDSLYTCWRTFDVEEIYTLSTADYASADFTKFPILFQRVDNELVSVRFSLLTKQYAINESAYTFWNSIQNQIANTSSLYNTQPYQIRGNVTNVADSDEPVLGYFLVASVSENRTFVDKPTDPNIELSKCMTDPMLLPLALMLPPANWPVYLTGADGGIGVTGLDDQDGCLDCREVGGTIVKPDFWE